MCDKGEKGLHGVIHIKCGDVVGKWDLQEFERELAEAGVKKMEMGSFKIPVIKMSDVPNLAKEMEKVKRIMISQPMSGKSFYEIKETRFKAMDKLEKEGFEIVNSFFTEEWIALNAGGIKTKTFGALRKVWKFWQVVMRYISAPAGKMQEAAGLSTKRPLTTDLKLCMRNDHFRDLTK